MGQMVGGTEGKASVIAVRWDRIHLFFDIQTEGALRQYSLEELEFYAVNGLNEAKVHFGKEQMGEGLCRLKMNLTNNGENRCVPTGDYRIMVCQSDEVLAECEAGISIIPHMDDDSRNFLYSRMNSVYTVTFRVKEGDDALPFRFRVLIAARTDSKFPVLQKHPMLRLPRTKKQKKEFLKRWIWRFYSIWRKILPKNPRKTVLFMTEQSNELCSNLKAVYDRMFARGLDREFRILYSARSVEQPQTKRSWFSLLKKLAESDYIFLDDHAPVLDWLPLCRGTTTVQLWHAGGGFKAAGYNRWGHEGAVAPVSCHRQYSYGIAGSKAIVPLFAEEWGINEERVLPTGMPRMDAYLDAGRRKEKERELYERFLLCVGKKVLLFAPTFRGKNKKDAHYPYGMIDFGRLYDACGDEYVVLFKAHPWVNNPLEIPERYADKFLDVKAYPDINDLFYITDLLITDYSSNIFEYSLMGKPMLFFAFDKIQYSYSRGFYCDYEEAAPGKVCATFEELMDAFENRDFEEEKVAKYVERHFDRIDGNASDRVIDWFLLGQMPEVFRLAIERQEEDIRHMNSLKF